MAANIAAKASATAAPYTALAFISFFGIGAVSAYYGFSVKASDLNRQHDAYVRHEEATHAKIEDLEKKNKELTLKLDKIEHPEKYVKKDSTWVSDGTPQSNLREKVLAPIFKL